MSIAKTEQEIREFMASLDDLSTEESQRRVNEWKAEIAKLPMEERHAALRAARAVIGEKTEEASDQKDAGLLGLTLAVSYITGLLIEKGIIDKDDPYIKRINDASGEGDIAALTQLAFEMIPGMEKP